MEEKWVFMCIKSFDYAPLILRFIKETLQGGCGIIAGWGGRYASELLRGK